MGGTVGLLFDAKRCVGCQTCVMACREVNGQPPDPPRDELTRSAYLAIEDRAGRFVRRSCMHCLDPACVSVCPVGAMRRSSDGAVEYRAELCMGCRYCLLACPFDVPRYEWQSPVPYVRKCTLCPERRASGRGPACADSCPHDALAYGRRDDLLDEARARIAGGGYAPEVFGLEAAGGTSVLLVADTAFADLGLPSSLPSEPLPDLSARYLHQVPGIVSVTGLTLAGLYWIIRRRQRIAGEVRGRTGHD